MQTDANDVGAPLINSRFSLITGSAHKLAEWQRIVPSSILFDHHDFDLEEIQSMDNRKIISHKVRLAYAKVNRPVVVEDINAGLDALSGLPGPFIKFFEQKLGPDALYQLAPPHNKATTVTCTVAYYDGTTIEIFEGVIKGHVVALTAGSGYGFDHVFVPQGHDQTFSQMSNNEKNKISHRAQAVKRLVSFLS